MNKRLPFHVETNFLDSFISLSSYHFVYLTDYKLQDKLPSQTGYLKKLGKQLSHLGLKKLS